MRATPADTQFGSFRLSPQERRLLQDGQEVPLTPKAFDTLQVLVSRAGQLVEKQDLMKAVWGEVFVDDNTLTQNIFTIRKALGDGQYIETVPRRGYRFTAPVTALEPPPEQKTPPAKRAISWIATAVAAAFVVSAVAAWVDLRGPYNPIEGSPSWTPITESQVNSDGVISPDGKLVEYLAESNGSHNIMMFEVGTGTPYLWSTGGWAGAATNLVKDLGFNGRGWVWNRPDVGGVSSGRLQVRHLRDDEPTAFLEKDAALPVWSPDGTRLVYARTGEPIIPGDAPASYRDSLYITDGEASTTSKMILAGNKPGSDNHPVAGPHNHPMAWSADGAWIYLTRGELGVPNEFDLWRIRPNGEDLEQLTDLNSDVGYPVPIGNREVLYLARDDKGAGPWLWSLDVETKKSIRIPAGTLQFISLSGSKDGRHVVATIAKPSARLRYVPIFPDRVAGDADVKDYDLPEIQRAMSPRFTGKPGSESLFFLSPNIGGDGLRQYREGKAIEEVWDGSKGALFDPPVVSPDGKIAIQVRINGRKVWHIVGPQRTLSSVGANLPIVGNATWNPEGTALLAGVSDSETDKEGALYLIPVDGSTPKRFFSGYARNPIWSRERNLIVYSGKTRRGAAPLLALDGATQNAVELPAEAEVGGTSQQSGQFHPDGKSLIYQRGSTFLRLDLLTKKLDKLAQINLPGTSGNFDITPDGKSIVFDVLRRNSDIYLIEVPDKPWYRRLF